MTNEAVIVLAIISIIIWIAVYTEAVKPSKEMNRQKMITLLSAGTLSAIIITVSLVLSLLL